VQPLERSAVNAPRHPPLVSEPWLRERFAPLRPYQPVTSGDGHTRWRPEQLRRAAVLVPVVSRGGDLSVLLTRRTAHLHDHAGQISFPGGRAEPHDPTPAATALRETEEETGVSAGRIEVLGTLSDYVTVTGYRVTPVVGLLRAPFDLQPDAFEVAEVFEVPLPFLLDPANHQRNAVVVQGFRRHYYAMPYRGYYIWGATAGMLMNLHAYLTAAG
jgi:8-oxo-dGTP pyrophosphatase MutT (NUDIX family)